MTEDIDKGIEGAIGSLLGRPMPRRRMLGLSGMLAAASLLPTFDGTPLRFFAGLDTAYAATWYGYYFGAGATRVDLPSNGWWASAEECYERGWVYYNATWNNPNHACGGDTYRKLCRFTIDLRGGMFATGGDKSPQGFDVAFYNAGIYRGNVTVMMRYGTADYNSYFHPGGFKKTGYAYKGLYDESGSKLLWDDHLAICPGYYDRAWNGYWMNHPGDDGWGWQVPVFYEPNGNWWYPYWHGADQSYGQVKWEPISYSIGYSLAGGSFGGSHPTHAVYDVPFSVDNPKRTGHAFAGWTITGMDSSWEFDLDRAPSKYLGSSSGALSAFSANSLSGRKETWFKNLRTTAGTVTFAASWTPFKLTVRYHPNNELNREFAVSDSNNGGRAAGDPMRTDAFPYDGTDLAQHGLPDLDGGTWKLVRKHYETTGMWLVGSWNSGRKVSEASRFAKVQDFANAIGYPIDAGNRTVDLYAEWRIKQYTVTYFRDGEQVRTTKFDALTRLGADGGWAVSNARRNGCSGGIDGNAWYVDAAGTVPYAGGRLEADLKLYAFNLCTVTFGNGDANLPDGKDVRVYGTSGASGIEGSLDSLSEPPAAIAAIRYGSKLDLDRESTQYTTAKGAKTYARTAVGRRELWSYADAGHAYQVNAEAGWHTSRELDDAAKISLTVTGDTALYKRWDPGYYEGVRS